MILSKRTFQKFLKGENMTLLQTPQVTNGTFQSQSQKTKIKNTEAKVETTLQVQLIPNFYH